MNKDTKKINEKTLIIILLILSIIIGITMMIYKSKSKLKLISNDTDIVEYGENYSTNLYDILDLSILSNDQVKDILKKSKIINNFKYEIGGNGEKYPQIGEYEVHIKYKNQNICKNVEVKDTTPPKLTLNKTYFEIPQNTFMYMYHFEPFYTSEDKSITTTYYDMSKINSKKPGNYKMKVISKDTSGNKTIKEVTVKVKEQPKIVASKYTSKPSQKVKKQSKSSKIYKSSKKNKSYLNDENDENNSMNENNVSNNPNNQDTQDNKELENSNGNDSDISNDSSDSSNSSNSENSYNSNNSNDNKESNE
jgi:hypothetical protein